MKFFNSTDCKHNYAKANANPITDNEFLNPIWQREYGSAKNCAEVSSENDTPARVNALK